MRRRKRRGRSGRTTVRWALGAFLAGLVALNAVADAGFPVVYDPEYAARLDALHAIAPQRPLLAVVGSSRVAFGFAPEGLPPLRTPAGEVVAPFNYGHIGAGPVFQLMLVRRMLAAGVRPRWLVVELMPSYVGYEDKQYVAQFAAASDLPVLARIYGPTRATHLYCSRRFRDSPRYPKRFARAWLPGVPQDMPLTRLQPLGGSMLLEDDVDDAARERRTAHTFAMMADGLRTLPSPPQGDRAVRDLLDLCGREGIRVALIYTPEGSVFRSWYDPDRLAAFESYRARLVREYSLPFVDARDWLDDGDFYDSHHALRRGATKFSRRLHDEVLVPLVARD